MYEILGFNYVNNAEGVLSGIKFHLVESAFSSASQGNAVMSLYLPSNKIQGNVSVGAHCDLIFMPGKNGAYPAAIIIK